MQPVNSNLSTLIESFRQKPIARIKVYPSSKTIPSLGFKVCYYLLDNDDAIVSGGDNWMGTAGSSFSDVASGVNYKYPSVNTELDNIIEPQSSLSFDWGVGGSPSPVGQSHLFAVRWHTFFHARYAGVYRMYLDLPRHARARIKFNGSYPTIKDSDDNTVSNWTTVGMGNGTKGELYIDTPSLTKGNFYELWIEYWVSTMKSPPADPTFLVVKCREPQSVTTDLDLWGNSGGDIVSDYPSDSDIKLLSAGVVSCTQPDGTRTGVTTGNVGFLAGSTLTQIKSIHGNRDRDSVAEYSFEIPVPNATVLTGSVSAGNTSIAVKSTDGFPSSGYGKIGTDKFTYTGKTSTTLTGIPSTGDMALLSHSVDDVVHLAGAGDYPYNPKDNSFGVIKPFQLCRIEMGYQDFSSTDYYADRIWGFIYPNPVLTRSADGTDVLKVFVQDFRSLLITDYFRNFPDFASYSGARYYSDHLLTEPNGITRPMAYDRWNLALAVRDILVKANIDPVWLYGRQRMNVNGGANYAKDYGDYTIRSNIQLDSKKKYGNPNLTGDNADEAYNWSFGWGQKFMDGLAELAKNFLYQFSFHPGGNVGFNPINIPSTVTDDRDMTVTTNGGAVDNTKTDLECYKGTYTEVTYDSAAPILDPTIVVSNFIGNDWALIFKPINSGTPTKVKIRVNEAGGGYAYLSTIIWKGSELDAVSDEFTLNHTETRRYYEGEDNTGFNPCIIQPVDALAFGTHSIEIEVTNGIFNIDALFVYKNSVRKNTRDIDSTQMGESLSVESNLEDLRNDWVVTGAFKGQITRNGLPVNPNNPVSERTYSRAVDLGSIHDASTDNYLGRHVRAEVFNERILDQTRANHIAINALKKYKDVANKAVFQITGDPRLMPFDAIGITEKKLNTLNANREWIDNISEQIESGKYITSIGESVPHEPISSFEGKADVDISNYNNEPLINLEMRSRGFRISGDDMTRSGNVMTITTSPGWDTDMWVGYYVYDNSGKEYKITANTANTLTVELNGQIVVTGNWSISFDPFDTVEKGAPLEIHFDQIIDATVQISIIDGEGDEIARVNPDTWDVPQEWGPNKVFYWSGIGEGKMKEGKAGCYVNPISSDYIDYMKPLIVVIPTDKSINTSVFEGNGEDPTSGVEGKYLGILAFYGSAAQQSPSGSMRIFPKLLYQTPMVKVYADGGNYADDIQIYGYVSAVADNGSDKDITILPNPTFTLDQYNSYLLCDLGTGYVFNIIDTFDGNKVTIKGSGWVGSGGAVNDLIVIIGQGANGLANLIHDYFKSSDNSGAGLKLLASIYTTTHNPEGGKGVRGPYSGGSSIYDCHISVNGVSYNENTVHLSAQHYPDRNVYVKELLIERVDPEDGQPTGEIEEIRIPIPSGNVLSKPEFRIRADIEIYKLSNGRFDFIGGEDDFIKGESFQFPSDWVHYMLPNNIVLEDKNLPLVNRASVLGESWCFLYRFSFMDRAGRSVPNESIDRNITETTGKDSRFSYLVGWKPEGSPTATLKKFIAPIEMRYTSLFKYFTKWTL